MADDSAELKSSDPGMRILCIGETWRGENDTAIETVQMYDKLEHIMDIYYNRPDDYARIMAHCIALNGSFFTAQRMVLQYAARAYRLTA